MLLSRKTKEAIKTALAMTIAYGISLHMGWEESMWAGFAVAFISLATVGQSLNKAAMRMFGTLIAAAMALIIIASFAQDRWLFMLFLSAWIGFCTYKMGGSKNQYVWHVSGFACVIICMDGGLDPVNAFNTAMLRTQQTGLGILVYSLVAIFLWPINARAEFDVATGKLASIQQQMYQLYMKLLISQGDIKGNDKEKQTLMMQEVQVLGQFKQLLSAAMTDSYEVSEFQQQWQRYQQKVVELSETMASWHDGFAEIQSLDLTQLLPGLPDFDRELDERFKQIHLMLAGEVNTQVSQAVELFPNQDALKQLSHFNKAAFTVSIKRLQSLNQLTSEMFDIVRDIKGLGSTSIQVDERRDQGFIFLPDLDRMAGVLRIVVSMWIAYLALIYVSDIPGGGGIVSMVVPIGMALANMPQLPVSKMFMPVLGSILYTSLLYIFVMPQLSSFFSLGLLLFAVTFSVCYLFSAPQQMLNRAFGLALFVSIAGISNEQTYSFFAIANTSLMFTLVLLILAFSAYIPFSPHPEKSFLRLLGRFFRSSDYLIATMYRDPQRPITRLEQWKKAFHMHELTSLPQKISTWGRFIDPGFPGTSAEQVQTLTTNLQALTYRMQDLLEVRDSLQAESLVQELLEDIHSWQSRVQEAFQLLSKDPTIGNRDRFHARLTEIMEHFETRIKETLNKMTDDQINVQDSENFYRLLGAYRGVSEALIGYTASTGTIKWSLWQEERF